MDKTYDASIALERIGLDDLPDAAMRIINFGKHKTIWLFNGGMGVGKTTLIKAICSAFGVIDNVSSPTFSIVNEYLNEKGELFYHFDFYRIEKEEEALDIGCNDYFNSGNTCFIEWSSNIPNLIPDDRLEINMSTVDKNTRSINITNHG